MNTFEIVKWQFEKGHDEDSLRPLLKDNFTTIRRSLSQILLIYISDLKYQLETLFSKHNIKDGFLTIKKIESSFNDFAYYGFWHCEANFSNTKKTDTINEINDEIEKLFDGLIRYDYKINTNTKYEFNEEVVLSIKELSKMYDVFIPDDILIEYRAALLEYQLSNNTSENYLAGKI